MSQWERETGRRYDKPCARQKQREQIVREEVKKRRISVRAESTVSRERRPALTMRMIHLEEQERIFQAPTTDHRDISRIYM